MRFVSLEQRGSIDILSFVRPEVANAICPDMADEISSYFGGLQSNPSVRVVIVRGEGRHFCAGAELGSSAFITAGAERIGRATEMQRRYSAIPRAMRACPQPIIGLVQGSACGAGFSILLACDVRYAASGARMNAAYLRIGLGGCDMGSGYFLPRLVGASIASELLLSGRFIDAERARAVGLVSDVVPADALLETGLSLANDMLLASPIGLRVTKETLNLELDAPSLDAAITLEDRQQVMLLGTEEHAEAASAFLVRQRPALT